MSDDLNLTGKLLIAMPGMQDSRFSKSVVLICAHSGEGTMGLIVNKPTPDLRMRDLLEQLSIPASSATRDMAVYFGGPVEHGRGFVLHSPEYRSQMSSMVVNGDYAMTATQDILEEFALGAGPDLAIMALGYAGWGPNQLEAEIGENGWLTSEAPPDLVFARDDALKWEAALKTLGVDPIALSVTAGRA